jgi:hypothetical protein
MERRACHQGLSSRQSPECRGQSPTGPRVWARPAVQPLSVPSELTQPRRCARRPPPPPNQNIKAADGPYQASEHPPAVSTQDRDRTRLSEERTRPSREPRPTPGPRARARARARARNSYTPLAPPDSVAKPGAGTTPPNVSGPAPQISVLGRSRWVRCVRSHQEAAQSHRERAA